MPFTFIFNGGFFDLEHLFQRSSTASPRRTASGELSVSGRLLTIQSVKLAPVAELRNRRREQRARPARSPRPPTCCRPHRASPAPATATSPTGAATPASSTAASQLPDRPRDRESEPMNASFLNSLKADSRPAPAAARGRSSRSRCVGAVAYARARRRLELSDATPRRSRRRRRPAAGLAIERSDTQKRRSPRRPKATPHSTTASRTTRSRRCLKRSRSAAAVDDPSGVLPASSASQPRAAPASSSSSTSSQREPRRPANPSRSRTPAEAEDRLPRGRAVRARSPPPPAPTTSLTPYEDLKLLTPLPSAKAAAGRLPRRHRGRQERDLHARRRSDPARRRRMPAERHAVRSDRPQARADRAAGIPRPPTGQAIDLRTDGRRASPRARRPARRSRACCAGESKAGREAAPPRGPAGDSRTCATPSQAGVLVFAGHSRVRRSRAQRAAHRGHRR